MADLLDPCIKGVHLKLENLYEKTVESMEELADGLKLVHDASPNDDSDDEDTTELSPLESLKKRFASGDTVNADSAVRREIMVYDSLPEPADGDVLLWWRRHSASLPVLSALARHILAIPAASSKSERVFSCAGNTVTTRRTRLDADKVEMLVILKQNTEELKKYTD